MDGRRSGSGFAVQRVPQFGMIMLEFCVLRTEWSLLALAVHLIEFWEIRDVFQLNDEGTRDACFHVWRISPRRCRRRSPAGCHLENEPRGVVFQVLDRLVERARNVAARRSDQHPREQQAQLRLYPALPHQKAAPAFDLEMPLQNQPARAVGGDHAFGPDAAATRKNNQPRWRQMAAHLRRHLPQRIGQEYSPAPDRTGRGWRIAAPRIRSPRSSSPNCPIR